MKPGKVPAFVPVMTPAKIPDDSGAAPSIPQWTDWLEPESVTQIEADAKGGWTDPSYAGSLDEDWATAEAESDVTDRLRMAYGFDIPAGSTILGLEARIYYRGGSVSPCSLKAQLRHGGADIGELKAEAIIEESFGEWRSFGAIDDLWDAELTAAIINALDGLDVHLAETEGVPAVVDIDSIQMRVRYQ